MKIEKIVNFIFELGQLTKKKNEGWRLIGIHEPNSIADHVLRAAQIGYILAIMEGNATPEKVATIIMLHNNGKTRIGDQDKVASRYMFRKEAEEMSFSDQIDGMDMHMERKFLKLFQEFNERDTEEGIISQDADWLEQAFQAKEYYDLGRKESQTWLDNIEKALETKSAKLIFKQMKNTKFDEWWRGLMYMTYNKL